MLTVGAGSYGVASAAFLGLFALLCLGWISRHWAILALIAATLCWAVVGCWLSYHGDGHQPAYDLLDFARSIALLFLINDALYRLSGDADTAGKPHQIGTLVPLTALVALVLSVLRLTEVENALLYSLVGQVATAVIGLLLVENLFQMSRPNSLWTTKHLLIGAGTIFAFDLFFYTEALLFLRIDETIRSAQPIIAVLSIPLILVSARRLNDIVFKMPVSRELVISTTALLASGVYILAVAGIAYLIRGLGWTWGPTLQLTVFVGAAMVLLVLLSSTSLRHGGRRFIERNLFTFAYDYRREWLRLVNGMANTADELPLDKRALKTTATLLDADSGVLFMRRQHGGLDYKSSWNVAADAKAPPKPPAALCAALAPKRASILFDAKAPLTPEFTDCDGLKHWLGHFRDPWIALGLFAQHELVGLIMITRPRMRRRLTFEDLDLLEIFSQQLGSYLAAEELGRQIAEAQHFDRMSKHVTFVAHDLKNLISQLSLILQQAKHHAGNPAFVSDSFLTIGDAVEKMTLLMRRVQEGAQMAAPVAVDLTGLIQRVNKRHHCDRIDLPTGDHLLVKVDPVALESVLDHVIDNAKDACREGGEVKLSLLCADGKAHLAVIDSGIGMSRDFIETRMFRPFSSTKKSGFGIGMYQCRDWVQRWQGDVIVESELGQGTTVIITLPIDELQSTAADSGGSTTIETTLKAGASSAGGLETMGERAA